MRTTPSPAATAGRFLARLVKAGLSLLVLAVAVAGLPLLLAWATPVIWAATSRQSVGCEANTSSRIGCSIPVAAR